MELWVHWEHDYCALYYEIAAELTGKIGVTTRKPKGVVFCKISWEVKTVLSFLFLLIGVLTDGVLNKNVIS